MTFFYSRYCFDECTREKSKWIKVRYPPVEKRVWSSSWKKKSAVPIKSKQNLPQGFFFTETCKNPCNVNLYLCTLESEKVCRVFFFLLFPSLLAIKHILTWTLYLHPRDRNANLNKAAFRNCCCRVAFPAYIQNVVFCLLTL